MNKSLYEGKHCLQRGPRPCSSAAVLGSMWEDPSSPAPGSHLTPLRVLSQATPAPTGALGHCQSSAAPAWLPGQAGQPAWGASLLCGRSSPAALQAAVLPPGSKPGPMQSPPVLGARPRDTRGAGAGGQMPLPRAGSVGGWAPRRGLGRAGQTKGSQTPRGRLGSQPVPEC